MATVADDLAPSEVSTPALPSNPESAKLVEFAAFDLLRFLLASAVVLSHIGVLQWSEAGNLAVQVFFALSGWLIGSILYRTTPAELNRFYFNRATRIWIPYFATVTALYLISIVHEPVRSARWHQFLIYDVTFTHNWFSLRHLSEMPLSGTGNHLWSIAVEEQFYLVTPFVITLLPFGRKILPWAIISAVALLSQGWYASVSMGVLCAVAANTYRGWYLKLHAKIGLVVIAAIAAASMGVSQAYNFSAPVFAAALVLLCATPVRRNAITQWFGGVSFPFYLNAWIGVFVLHGLVKHFDLPDGWYSRPLLFLSSLGAAAISYQLIDRTVMGNRNRFYTARLGWALGGIGYTLVTSGVVYWLLWGRK